MPVAYDSKSVANLFDWSEYYKGLIREGIHEELEEFVCMICYKLLWDDAANVHQMVNYVNE